MSAASTKKSTAGREGKKVYSGPKVKTYGNIREITLTTAPYNTDMRDSGTFKASNNKTLVPR